VNVLVVGMGMAVAHFVSFHQDVFTDGAMIVGNFIEKSSLEKEMTVIFSKNNIPFQSIALQDILPKAPLALSMVSQRVTLRTGDLLAIPLESIFYPLEGETTWTALLQEERLFWVEVK